MKIKKCPHCGCKADVYQDYTGFYQVQCNVCGCGTLKKYEKEKAIELWNRRVK